MGRFPTSLMSLPVATLSAHPTDTKPLQEKPLFVAHGLLYSRKCAKLMFQVLMVKLGL